MYEHQVMGVEARKGLTDGVLPLLVLAARRREVFWYLAVNEGEVDRRRPPEAETLQERASMLARRHIHDTQYAHQPCILEEELPESSASLCAGLGVQAPPLTVHVCKKVSYCYVWSAAKEHIRKPICGENEYDCRD